MGMIAALYVETGGAYYGLPDVDPWDEARDARGYSGPHPVVAHPPCKRWSTLAYVVQKRHGLKVGADGGCFASALATVRRWGGVLEHPANSLAWKHFGLPLPGVGRWAGTLFDAGLATEVCQRNYGHRAEKRTWLYCVGEPPKLDWSAPEPAEMTVEHMAHAERRHTPPAFRDLLLSIARSVK